MFSSWTDKLKARALEGVDFVKKSATTVGSKVEKGVRELQKEIVSKVAEESEEFKRTEEQYDKQRRQLEASEQINFPPWVVREEAKTILEPELKQRIMKLSKDTNNFIGGTPEEQNFVFDVAKHFNVGAIALKEDADLKAMRFKLVPKKVSEELFWRNYFFRVSLIREAMRLEPLFPEQKSQQKPVASASAEAKPSSTASPAKEKVASPGPATSATESVARLEAELDLKGLESIISDAGVVVEGDIDPAETIDDAQLSKIMSESDI